MHVVMSGGTGVIGRAAVPALLEAGHDVTVLTRSPHNEELVEGWGARSRPADLFDAATLIEAYADADAVVNLATRVPVGYAAVWPGAWRRHDLLRTEAVRNVANAAREAGVRRLVQESVSVLYADAGDDWIDEQSPVEITPATEPAAVSESHVDNYVCESRVGVVLRFGAIVGDDPQTRFWLRAAAGGRPVGIGRPDAWRHLVHTDDLGGALVAALTAPGGTYNVGAEPTRTSDLIDAYAAAAGGSSAYLGPVLRRLVGERAEPIGRSLRVSSREFASATGWRPIHGVFGLDWFDAVGELAQR